MTIIGSAVAAQAATDKTVEVSARAQGRDQQVIFVLRLVPKPGVDGIKALRAVLKILLRRFGLRCISIKQDERP
jgi:hypothetical protein